MLTKLEESMISRFVEKSGGLAKVEKALIGFRGVPNDRRVQFIRNCCRTDEGAKQIMAAAMLGFAVATEVTKRLKKDEDVEDWSNIDWKKEN